MTAGIGAKPPHDPELDKQMDGWVEDGQDKYIKQWMNQWKKINAYQHKLLCFLKTLQNSLWKWKQPDKNLFHVELKTNVFKAFFMLHVNLSFIFILCLLLFYSLFG